MITNNYKVREYLTANGRNYFRAWLATLPIQVAARIQARIARLEAGNLGDYKHVGHGVYELRLNVGPGYRGYFGFDGPYVVILLSGSDKSSQGRGIVRARQLWLDYAKRSTDEQTKR